MSFYRPDKWQEGSFEVRVREGKYQPSTAEDFFKLSPSSMGVPYGDKLLLVSEEWNPKQFQIVNLTTGDSIEINVIDWVAEFEQMWKGMTIVSKRNCIIALEDGRKIEAIKIIRQETGCDIKTGKMMIDSQWMWNKVDILKGTRPSRD